MTSTSPTLTKETFPTGIELLDDHLNGGLYSGSIVALLADPSSQSELLLSRLTTEQQTLYLTLQRTPEAVARSLKRSGADMDNTAIRDIGHEQPLDDAYVTIMDVPTPTNVIVDPINAIETVTDHRLWTFLNAAQAHLIDVGGLLILHCLTGQSEPPGRMTTLYMADVIFKLETDDEGDMIENRLLVPKIRGGKAISKEIKLELTHDVSIDTSRSIN